MSGDVPGPARLRAPTRGDHGDRGGQRPPAWLPRPPHRAVRGPHSQARDGLASPEALELAAGETSTAPEPPRDIVHRPHPDHPGAATGTAADDRSAGRLMDTVTGRRHFVGLPFRKHAWCN